MTQIYAIPAAQERSVRRWRWCSAALLGVVVVGGMAGVQPVASESSRRGFDPDFRVPAIEVPEISILKQQVKGLEGTIAQLESRVAALEFGARADKEPSRNGAQVPPSFSSVICTPLKYRASLCELPGGAGGGAGVRDFSRERLGEAANDSRR